MLLLLIVILLLLQLSLSIKPSDRWRREDGNDKLDLSNSMSSIIDNAKKSVLGFFGYENKEDNNNINLKEYLTNLEKETKVDYDLIGNEMEIAKQLINDKQYYEAVNKLLDILEVAPFLGSANSLVGASLLALGMHENAEGFLYVAVQLSEWSDAIAIGNLAQALLKSNDIDLAEKILYQGITTLKNNKETDTSGFLAYSLGNINKMKLNYQVAADWYLSSALNNPSNVQYWLEASTTTFPFENWDYKFAENVLLQALENHRNNVDILFKMAYILHTGTPSRVKEAITFYEEVLTLQHDHPDALKSLATAYHSLGRFNDAVKLYEKALSHHNDQDYIMLSNYATLLLQSDNKNLRERGNQLAKKASGLNPSHPDVVRATELSKSITLSHDELYKDLNQKRSEL